MSTFTRGLLCLLHAGVFTIYSAPRVGSAVGYLVDIVYLGYSPPHDPRDFSSRRRVIARSPLVAAREEASTKRLLSAGPPVPGRQMVRWHISALGQRRLIHVTAVGFRCEIMRTELHCNRAPETSVIQGPLISGVFPFPLSCRTAARASKRLLPKQ